MSQRYTSPVALERMAAGTCPECGKPSREHSAAPEFWLRPSSACDLLPHGVSDRITQYERDAASPSGVSKSRETMTAAERLAHLHNEHDPKQETRDRGDR